MEPWTMSAACAETDPALFEPTTKRERQIAGNVVWRIPRVVMALTICAGCDVVAECREQGSSYTDIAMEGTYGAEYVGSHTARDRLRAARRDTGKTYLHSRRPFRQRGDNRTEVA